MLGWIQLTLRDIKRRVEVDMVQSNKFEESMDVLSVGYHGCCKIVSQPLPFAYEQLIAMLTQLYCFTVPVCFITSFGFYIFLPVYLIRSGLALASPSPSPNPNPNPNPSPNPSPSPSPNPNPNPNQARSNHARRQHEEGQKKLTLPLTLTATRARTSRAWCACMSRSTASSSRTPASPSPTSARP